MGEKFCLGRDSVVSFCWKQHDSHMCMTEEAKYQEPYNHWFGIALSRPFMIPAQSKFWNACNPSTSNDASSRLFFSMKCTIKTTFHLYSWKETFTFDSLQWRMNWLWSFEKFKLIYHFSLSATFAILNIWFIKASATVYCD